MEENGWRHFHKFFTVKLVVMVASTLLCSRVMYEINPRMLANEAVALFIDTGPHQRLLEMSGESGVGAAAAAKSVEPRKSTRKEKKFAVGDEVLVDHGPDCNKIRKWAAFESYFISTVRALWPKLITCGTSWLLLRGASRQGINSQRLVPYWKRPTQLLRH